MSIPPGPWTPLVAQADTLPDSPAKLALLEEAVRVADTHGDVLAGFRLRDQYLFRAAIRLGRPEKALVVFVWLLAQCDREPGQFDAVQLCREHIGTLLRLVRDAVDIPRAQVEALLTDARTRLHEPYPRVWILHQYIAFVHAIFGDAMRAGDAWERRNRYLPTPLGDWAFAVSAGEVEYHLFRGDEHAALRAAEPLFQWTRTGRTDGTFEWVSAHLLLPLHRTDRTDEARYWQLTQYPNVRNQIVRLGEIGRHIEFLAAVGDLDQAVRLFERRVGWLLLNTEAMDQFHFHLAGWLLSRRLLSRSETVRLRLPADLSCHRADGVYDVNELAEYFGGVARGIAGRYDARAGNDCFSRTLLAPVWAMG